MASRRMEKFRIEWKASGHLSRHIAIISHPWVELFLFQRHLVSSFEQDI